MPQIATKAVETFGKGVIHSEGVLVDKDNNVYGGGRNCILYKVTPDNKVSEFARLPDGSICNGVAMDKNGDIVYCDLGKQAMMRASPGGKISMIADAVGGIKLTMPNFATYDAEGNLFVSNSSSKLVARVHEEFTKPEPLGALVRIRPNGKGDVVATGLYIANGTAIDPKEEAVYVLQSSRNDCLRIPLNKNGTFGKPEVFSKDFPGIPDGMAFAADGTLFVTLPMQATREPVNKILRVDTNGKWEVFIDDGAREKLDHTTNCAFGGPDMQDLYIANLHGEQFGKVHTGYRGHPLYHQR